MPFEFLINFVYKIFASLTIAIRKPNQADNEQEQEIKVWESKVMEFDCSLSLLTLEDAQNKEKATTMKNVVKGELIQTDQIGELFCINAI